MEILVFVIITAMWLIMIAYWVGYIFGVRRVYKDMNDSIEKLQSYIKNYEK